MHLKKVRSDAAADDDDDVMYVYDFFLLKVCS
jgi:hypothetical protein